MKTLLLALLLSGPLPMALPNAAADEPAPAADAAKADAEGFQKINGSMLRGESMPANKLVAAAYGIIFLALLGYVFSVARRTRRVEDEMAELQNRLK